MKEVPIPPPLSHELDPEERAFYEERQRIKKEWMLAPLIKEEQEYKAKLANAGLYDFRTGKYIEPKPEPPKPLTLENLAERLEKLEKTIEQIKKTYYVR